MINDIVFQKLFLFEPINSSAGLSERQFIELWFLIWRFLLMKKYVHKLKYYFIKTEKIHAIYL